MWAFEQRTVLNTVEFLSVEPLFVRINKSSNCGGLNYYKVRETAFGSRYVGVIKILLYVIPLPTHWAMYCFPVCI